MWDIGNNTNIGVKLFCMYLKAKKPFGRALQRDTNKPLKSSTKQMCAETGNILYPSEIGTFIPV